MALSEKEVRRLMESDAYTNRTNKNYEKVNREVKQGWENLYPDDDRNENPENYYVWRTQGDDRVRSKHAEREGEVFCWDEPPEGGHPGEDYNCRCWAEPYIPPEQEKDGTGNADTEGYISFGDRALATMSGLFGISEAKAKEPEIDAVTYASGSEMDKAIAATKRVAPDAFERYLSRQNLLERGKNIKKFPPVPPKKPEYNPNNLLETKSNDSVLQKAKRTGIYKENAKFDRLVDSVFGEEGDFEDDLNKIDQPTNMGIIQGTLNNFNKAHPELKINKSLKDITRDDAKLIYKLDFYDAYRIDEIDSPVLRLTIFDTLVNHSPHDPVVWIQEALNNKIGLKVKKDGILGSETIKALNSLRSEYEVKNVNNYILEKRREDLENNKEKNIRPNYEQYTKGIPGRIDRLIVK